MSAPRWRGLLPDAVALQLLERWAEHLPAVEVDEVRRLVLLTAGHHTQPGDHAGARLCDADLSGLGADWASYVGNVEGIRRELPGLREEQWRTGRSGFLARFLEREWLFASERGRQAWERSARENLTRELDLLRT